jgi:hypothetical protein
MLREDERLALLFLAEEVPDHAIKEVIKAHGWRMEVLQLPQNYAQGVLFRQRYTVTREGKPVASQVFEIREGEAP